MASCQKRLATRGLPGADDTPDTEVWRCHRRKTGAEVATRGHGSVAVYM